MDVSSLSKNTLSILVGLKFVGLTEFNGTNAISKTIHTDVYGVMVLTLQRSAKELNTF